MPEYRIVFNGYEYKIQEKKYTFWKRKPQWEDVFYFTMFCNYGTIQTFSDLKSAEIALESLKRNDARMIGEWREVKDVD